MTRPWTSNEPTKGQWRYLRKLRKGPRWYAKDNTDMCALAAKGFVKTCGETPRSFWYELTPQGRNIERTG